MESQKAVIQKIEPESPPENEGVGLRIKLTVQEILVSQTKQEEELLTYHL